MEEGSDVYKMDLKNEKLHITLYITTHSA